MINCQNSVANIISKNSFEPISFQQALKTFELGLVNEIHGLGS